jgi:hypothetical protein
VSVRLWVSASLVAGFVHDGWRVIYWTDGSEKGIGRPRGAVLEKAE